MVLISIGCRTTPDVTVFSEADISRNTDQEPRSYAVTLNQELVMATEAKQTYFVESAIGLQLYLEHTKEHKAVLPYLREILPEEFKRIGAEKCSLDVLGVGSGRGEVDIEMLSLLQSTFPAVPITANIVEFNSELAKIFKALVAKTPNLQKIPFVWDIMKSEDYKRKVQAKGGVKKFDFIHMIQVIYYVDDLADTIKFYHSLLKNNGRLMIIVEECNGGWDTLWKKYKNELCADVIAEYRSSAEVIACAKSFGLKYEEHLITHNIDITECFNPSSQTGEEILNFLTERDHFYESFTPEIRAGILDLLRNKCSTEKDGRILLSGNLSCLLIHA